METLLNSPLHAPHKWDKVSLRSFCGHFCLVPVRYRGAFYSSGTFNTKLLIFTRSVFILKMSLGKKQ